MRPWPGSSPGCGDSSSTSWKSEDTAFDGVSELWFDSSEAFEDAYASEIGMQVAQDSLANVAGRVRLLVDERVQLEG